MNRRRCRHPLTLISSMLLPMLTMLCQKGIAQPAVYPGDEWQVATPASQGVEAAWLDKALNFLKTKTHATQGVDEVAIVRNGRMIWEGSKTRQIREVYSINKPITSTVLGLLIDDGATDIDRLVQDYVPAVADKYADMSLRHLATMTSGYRAAGEQPPYDISDTPLAPDTPYFTPPGSQFYYSNGSTMDLMSAALTAIAGEPIEDLFRRRVADPIGLKGWAWNDLGNQSPPDGPLVNSGGYGFQVSAHELARLGLLFLNRGMWDGKSLLSASWVDAATSPQAPAAIPVHPQTDYSAPGGPGVYGFNWWVNGTRSDGSALYPGTTEGTYSGIGALNNRLFVIPEWDMVIVRTASRSDEAYVSESVWGEFLSQVGLALLPANSGDINNNGLLDAADMDLLSAAIHEQLQAAIYDVDHSLIVDAADRQFWIRSLANTFVGDSNLDGEFNTQDMIAVFQAGEYEDAVSQNSGWASGDWNGDQEFDSGDLVGAFQDGGYEAGPRAAVSMVPEPHGVVSMMIALLSGANLVRRYVNDGRF